MAHVLLFNITSQPWNSKLRIVLLKSGISAVDIPPSEQSQTISALLKDPGSLPGPSLPSFSAFSEPMMVMDGFRPGQLDLLLAAMKTARIPSIQLKAMVTPVNRNWTAVQLHEELCKERDALRPDKKAGPIHSAKK